MREMFHSALFALIALSACVYGGAVDDQCRSNDLQAMMVHLRELTTRTNESIAALQMEVTKLKDEYIHLENMIRIVGLGSPERSSYFDRDMDFVSSGSGDNGYQ